MTQAKTDKLARDTKESVPPFEQHAENTVRRMRGALAELFNTVNADATRLQDVARRFGLNKNLTWKISKIIQENDASSVIPHIPGTAGIRIFLDAFKKGGAPEAAIETVRSAVDDFEQMVKIHSGDRATLGMMLGGLSENGELQQQLENSRKLAFQGNCATWGVQARIQLNTTFVAPNPENPETLDLAMMNGFLDFRRLRSDIAWTIAARRTTYDDGTPRSTPGIEPLEPTEEDDSGVPFFRSFCSPSLPRVREIRTPDHVLYHQLEEGPVGNTAAFDCILAGIVRGGLPRFKGEKNDYHQFFATPATPVNVFMMDVYLHKDTGCNLNPELGIFSNLPGAPHFPAQGFSAGRLHLGERLESLGSAPPIFTTSEIPQYTKMNKTLLKRVGWNAGDFSGHRVVIRFPPIPSMVVFRYELQDASR